MTKQEFIELIQNKSNVDIANIIVNILKDKSIPEIKEFMPNGDNKEFRLIVIDEIIKLLRTIK